MAVLPTPGSPISTGLFFVRRDRIWITRSISRLRPMVGSGARGMVGVAFGVAPDDSRFDALRTAFLARYEQRLLQETAVFAAISPVLVALGRMHLVASEWEKARRYYRQLLMQNCEAAFKIEAYTELARIHETLNEGPKAAGMYERALKEGQPAYDPSWMWPELGLEPEANAAVSPPMAHERVAELVPGSAEVSRAVAEATRTALSTSHATSRACRLSRQRVSFRTGDGSGVQARDSSAVRTTAKATAQAPIERPSDTAAVDPVTLVPASIR